MLPATLQFLHHDDRMRASQLVSLPTPGILDRERFGNASERTKFVGARFSGRWACGVKCGDVRRQVHRLENLLFGVLALDERDQTERGLALRAENLDRRAAHRRCVLVCLS